MTRILSLSRPGSLFRLLGLAVLYCLLATFVLRLFAANGIVSIVWPPSGLAVAALLLGGRRYTVGIWLGAWVANLLAGSSPFVAAVIALGNTLEAVVAVYLLTRGSGFDLELRSLRDLLRLILLGAFVSATIAALAGATTLLIAGVIAVDGWRLNFVQWWMGDVLGIILVTPLILVWRHLPDWLENGRRLEGVLLLGLTFLVGQVVFLAWFNELFGHIARGYWVFLFITWAAARFGSHGVLALLFVTAVQALWGAHLDVGFFAGDMARTQLVNYWSYTVVLTIVGMALATYIGSIKRAEAMLQQSEETLYRAQAVAKTGSWALDLRNKLLHWTPESYRIFGVEPGTAINYETFLDCVHPDDRAFVDEQWNAALSGKTYNIEHRIVVGDEVRFVNERAEMRYSNDGVLIGSVGTVQEITERKRIMEELDHYRQHLEARVRERTAELSMHEARTRAILRSMLDGVVQIDAQGTILMANEALNQLFGYEEGELLGRNISVLMPEPHRTAHDSYIHRYLETRRSRIIGYRREVSGQHKDGSPLSLEVAINELVDDAGITFIGILSDIRDRKIAEESRETARAEASRLAQLKSEFLANMSHEIRTPLNAVIGLARIGVRENHGRTTSHLYERILSSGQHLLTVINDILDFSKIEADRLTVESLPFHLASTIHSVADMVSEPLHDKRLSMKLALAPDLPEWVIGDAMRIRQILVNLMSNAVKFTEQGEVSMAVGRHGDEIQFSIADSGIGMTETEISRLFRPFEQSDGSIARRFGGTGLGLAISSKLASLMGGKIGVESKPGVGSVFTLNLPLPVAEAGTDSALTTPNAGRRLNNLRVLAAEDVEINRFVLEDLLVQEGAAVTFAENGRQAIDFLTRLGASAFDVVLMDVQMPVMGGYEATRQIREIAPSLPIIGLTAHAMAEERDKCLAIGMVDHIAKPVNPDDLVAAILRRVPVNPPPRSLPADEAVLPTVAGGAIIDWQAFLARYGGRLAFIDKLVASVLESHMQTPTRLREAARTGDNQTISFLAHAIKGTSSMIDADAVSKLASRTDAGARSAEAGAARLAGELADRLDELLDALAASQNKIGR